MWKFLEQLREESEGHRRHVTLVAACVLTALVAVAWFMSVSAGTSSITYRKPSGVASTSALASVRDAFVQGTSALEDFVATLKNTTVIFTASSTLPDGSLNVNSNDTGSTGSNRDTNN